MDDYLIYCASTLPLQPSECDLLRTLLNQRIALREAERRRSAAASAVANCVLVVAPALERSASGLLFGRGWQVSVLLSPLLSLSL